MNDAPQIVLTTDRLLLRRFTLNDVDALFDLDSDPEVMRFLSRKPPTREDIETSVLPAILTDYERNDAAGKFAAFDRGTDAFIGWFALDGAVREPELGYRLGRTSWGRGLATEGSLALIDHGFQGRNVERIWAQTMAVNTGSRRVMEKCGMRHIRAFHPHFDDPLPGTEHGEVEYAITRDEWVAARQD